MSDKRTEAINIKVTKQLHVIVKNLAAKNDRSIQEQTIRLIKLGVHYEDFDPLDYE